MVKRKKRPKAKTKPRKELTQIRMDENLKGRILDYQTKLIDKGVAITFSATVRALIEKGLAAR